jgi:hypothetical protein
LAVYTSFFLIEGSTSSTTQLKNFSALGFLLLIKSVYNPDSFKYIECGCAFGYNL